MLIICFKEVFIKQWMYFVFVLAQMMLHWLSVCLSGIQHYQIRPSLKKKMFILIQFFILFNLIRTVTGVVVLRARLRPIMTESSLYF